MLAESMEELSAQLLAYERKNPKRFNAAEEIDSLATLENDENIRKFLERYSSPQFVAAGGSGLIFRVTFTPHQTTRALKVPRARLLKGDTPTQEEDPEVEALSKVSHQNIAKMYEDWQVAPGKHLVVSEWIESAVELHEYVDLVCKDKGPDADVLVLTSILEEIAARIYEISNALGYLHEEAGLYHFDVKPANLMVARASGKAKAYVIDLGLAQDISKCEGKTDIKVGFTWKYAHETLTTKTVARITHTQNKAKSTISFAELGPQYDLFAFGRTLQECLKIVRDYHGEKASSNYVFNYLHMLACLCLDGLNKNDSVDRTKQTDFVEDAANGCNLDLFRQHKITNFANVRHALERLIGRYDLERDVPELDPWFGSTINASDIAQVNLTHRIRRILVTPLFKRLEKEPQLGMLQEVFPTATHSRGNHSLGVYAAACRYISALYWDPDNPTFRILVTKNDIRKTLVASLIHDLGQTAFGHDVEEINEDLFSHSKFTDKLIALSASNKFSKELGESFKSIIEDPEPHGWALPDYRAVVSFLNGELHSPLDTLLHQIVDGPIDADKLDYLVRDSVNCRVQYGHGIDVARFLRSLTSICSEQKVGRKAHLELAIKAKGKASADAFTMARTQMYQALYWHHTFRAIKAMFLTGAAFAIADLEEKVSESIRATASSKEKNSKEKAVKERFKQLMQDGYFQHTILKPLNIDPSRVTDSDLFLKALIPDLSATRLTSMGGAPTDLSIDYFYHQGPPSAKYVLAALANRQIYKRLFEVPFSKLKNSAKSLDKFNSPDKRTQLTLDLNKAIREQLVIAMQDGKQSKYSFDPRSSKDTLVEWDDDHIKIVLDAPARAVEPSTSSPMVVADYRRKYSHVGRDVAERGDSASTSEAIQSILKEAAYFRAFAHPSIHDLILRYIDPSELSDTICRISKLEIKGD